MKFLSKLLLILILAAQTAAVPAHAEDAAKKEVNLPYQQMMGILMQNLTVWPLLSKNDKTKALEGAIRMYRNRDNIAILRSADFYASQMDHAIQANPDFQKSDIMTALKILSVMEDDFYNGQNREKLGKEVLGEKMYNAIQMRKPKPKR